MNPFLKLDNSVCRLIPHKRVNLFTYVPWIHKELIMMDKLAHDAYSQGAFDTLQSMDIPQYIKVAAAQELTKVASKQNIMRVLKGAISPSQLKSDFARGLTKATAKNRNLNPITQMNPQALKALRLRQATAATAGLGATGLLGGGTVGAMSLLGEEEPPPVVQAPQVEAAPEPPPELSLMEQAGNYGSDFLERAQAGDLSNNELAALAGAGVLGAGGLAYGLS